MRLHELNRVEQSAFGVGRDGLDPRLHSVVAAQRVQELVDRAQVRRPAAEEVRGERLPDGRFAVTDCPAAQRVVDGQGPEEGGVVVAVHRVPGAASPPDSTVWLTADCSMPGICGKP